MRKTRYFAVYIDCNIAELFRQKINRNYYRGKMREVVEKLLKLYVQDEIKV